MRPGVGRRSARRPRRSSRVVVATIVAAAAALVGISASGAISAPKLSSVVPGVLAQGASDVRLTLAGSEFQAGTKVVAGNGIAASSTVIDSATQLRTNLVVPAFAALGPVDVTVKNPDGGVGVCRGCLNVTPGPKVSTAAVGMSITSPLPAAPGSWVPAFADEFPGTTLNTKKWATKSFAESDGQQGNAGSNQQLEWNQPQNCTVGYGALTITARPDNITSPSGHHYDWSSCLITSTPSYAFQYGFIEERAQLPSRGGFWPALWTWQVPRAGTHIETDAYEYYSSDRTRLYLTQHSQPLGACDYTPPFDPGTSFHTYGVDIEPGGTTWYVDGVSVCMVPGTSPGLTNIISDLFVHSLRPPAAGTVERKRIDYIRAWHRATPRLSKASAGATVRLTGFNLVPGATATISGVNVTQATVLSAKQLRFQARVAPNATLGARAAS
jgi:hypothetical protein